MHHVSNWECFFRPSQLCTVVNSRIDGMLEQILTIINVNKINGNNNISQY